MKLSKITAAASLATCLFAGVMMSTASAKENTLGWKTNNAGRNDVFDVYEATRMSTPESSGTVGYKTSNPGRNDVYQLYEATRQPEAEAAGVVTIKTTNAHRNDVYDIYTSR